MPVYIDPVMAVGSFGDPSNDELTLEGTVSASTGGGAAGPGDLGADLGAFGLQSSTRRGGIPMWLIILGAIVFVIALSSENGK